MTPIELVLSKLPDAKRNGKGWSSRCPAHEDRSPSLSINVSDDGRVLMKCHAGCTVGAVCSAIRLELADLFVKDPNGRHVHATRTRQSDTVTKTQRKPALGDGNGDGDTRTFPTAIEAIKELERSRGARDAIWEYHNAVNELVGMVVRWDLPGGKKYIRPVSLTSSGWMIRGMVDPHPLYCLPDLLKRNEERVYVCEGERAVDATRSLGLLATTSPHGANSAAKADWSPMSGRDVVILPDHDDAGEQYATDVAQLATKAGAKSVRIARLVDVWADLPKGGDMADLVEHRGADLDAIRAEVEALADVAQPVSLDAPPPPLAWRPFPVDSLPDPLRSFTRDCAKAIGSDASFVALPALAVAASCIGNNYRVILKRGWTEPAILWCCAVGESGTLKSPGFKAVLRRVREVQQKLIDEHRKAMEDHAGEVARHEVNEKKWKSAGCVGDGPVAPEAPPLRRLIVSDCTVESLAPILLANPRGVLLARDELAGWIGAFDRYAGGKGSDAPNWLSMYDGETVVVDRRSGVPPTIYIPSASVSVTGTIQPGTLARVFSAEQRDNGMLARVLLAMPPGKPARWSDAEVSEAVEKRFATMIDNLLSLAPGVDEEGRPRPRLIGLDTKAKDAFVAWHDRHAGDLAEQTGDLAAAFSKLKGACARLALIFHCCRVADGDATLADPARIDLASIESAIAIVEWFKDEARRIYAMLSEGDEGRKRRQLVEWIERKGGSVTVRDLTHGLRQFRGDADGARKVLDELADNGDGRWKQSLGDKGGRPTERFHLVTTVTVTETSKITGICEGNGDGDAGDTDTVAGEVWGEEGEL